MERKGEIESGEIAREREREVRDKYETNMSPPAPDGRHPIQDAGDKQETNEKVSRFGRHMGSASETNDSTSPQRTSQHPGCGSEMGRQMGDASIKGTSQKPFL